MAAAGFIGSRPLGVSRKETKSMKGKESQWRRRPCSKEVTSRVSLPSAEASLPNPSVEVLTIVPHAMTLFGNRVIADVIG